MGVLIVAIIVILIIVRIACKISKSNKKDEEERELKDRIHNSQIIKDLEDQLKVFLLYTDFNWSHMQTDYYDDGDRLVYIYNEGIGFAVWKDNNWESLYYIGFVESLGYKPLLENNLKGNAKHIYNEEIFRAFANEVRDVLIKLFDDDGINFKYPEYFNGYEFQKQADGTSKRVKIGDEKASFIYTVPKTIEAKQM